MSSLVFRQLESRRVYADNKLDNAARDARLALLYETRGYGERKLTTPVSFGITFTEEPVFTHGMFVADHTLIPGRFPMGIVGVWDWQISNRGHWIGAYLFFNVYGVAGRLNWHLKFEGEAMKAVAGDEER